MPTLHARGNNNVSKIWIVVLIAFVAITVVVWDTLRSIKQIAADTEILRMHVVELLSE